MSKYSVNALDHFSEEELDGFVRMALETKDPSFYPDELLETHWLESKDGRGDGEYVVSRGSFIIADGLTELEADILLDELQAECDE